MICRATSRVTKVAIPRREFLTDCLRRAGLCERISADDVAGWCAEIDEVNDTLNVLIVHDIDADREVSR